MPRVSVIVPAYNAAGTISEALQSVVRQTFADWEVIVADDASTDGTADLAERVSPRVTVLRCDRNAGPAVARNAALRRASGELAVFLDADDWWLPTFLERQVALHDAAREEGTPVGIVAGNARIAAADGTLTDGTYLGQFRRLREPITLDGLLRRNVVYVSAMVPTEIGAAVGWFDAELRGTEDYGLWVKILERGHRVVLNREPLAVYRRTERSLSHDVAAQAAGNRKVLEGARERGRLTAAQRRIVAQELRYNRALETIASWAAGRGRPGVREIPNALLVAGTRPRHWPDWLRALRP